MPMAVKAVFKSVPIVVKAATTTTAIKAAIKPYSIAVAPSSSQQNFLKFFTILRILSTPFVAKALLSTDYLSCKWFFKLACLVSLVDLEHHSFRIPWESVHRSDEHGSHAIKIPALCS